MLRCLGRGARIPRSPTRKDAYDAYDPLQGILEPARGTLEPLFTLHPFAAWSVTQSVWTLCNILQKPKVCFGWFTYADTRAIALREKSARTVHILYQQANWRH